MLRRAGHEEDMDFVWQYVEDTVAPLIKRIYAESSSAMKLTQGVHEMSGNVNVWETLTKKMSTFTAREVNMQSFQSIIRYQCIQPPLNSHNTCHPSRPLTDAYLVAGTISARAIAKILSNDIIQPNRNLLV